jgi:23S rRNA (adenine2503-C2)-methyltransferase
MPGINDSAEEVAAIAAFASKLEKVIVNVIPYNPGREPLCRAPTNEETDRFIAALIGAGLLVKRRQLKGGSVMAACGQLGGRPCKTVHKNV